MGEVKSFVPPSQKSPICQPTPHTQNIKHTLCHLHRKLTVKRSRHLSGFFTHRRASEGRNKCTHLKSSLMARGENGNLIYMLYFISNSKCGGGLVALINETQGCSVTSVCVDFL